jgi:superfamily II DNA/RNA helicase
MAGSGPNQLTEDEKEKSIKAFETLGICKQLAEAAASLGWKLPTNIQEQAIPNVLNGKLPHLICIFKIVSKIYLHMHSF